MGAVLRHNTSAENNNLVSVFHRSHPVGDDKHSLSFHQMGDGLLNFRFVVHIQRGGGLVQ